LDWLKDFKAFVALAFACLVPLLFYAVMLQNRSQTLDDVQLLVLTRKLDLLRVPELISFAVIAMLILAISLKVIELKNRSTLFAFSFALVPIVVFNQQILTGRSPAADSLSGFYRKLCRGFGFSCHARYFTS
jgi:hypothetical protein